MKHERTQAEIEAMETAQDLEHDRLMRIAQLRKIIPEYKAHKCSYDERESGCPVCNDIDCFENELTYLEGLK